MLQLAKYLVDSGKFPHAKYIDKTAVRVALYRNCELQVKKYADKKQLVLLLFGYARYDIRNWAIKTSDRLATLDVGLTKLRGNPDKAGEGNRIVAKFLTSIDWRCDDSVYCQVCNVCASLEDKLLSEDVLERRIQPERKVSYVPAAEEIWHVLDGMPREVANEAFRFNMFDVLGVARMEIRHSNVLAWLLDPNAEHGFGTGLIRALLARAGMRKLADKIDLGSFVVKREWNHIDLLLKSEREKVIVAIENKIGASEGIKNGESQLKRYSDLIIRLFSNWKLEKNDRLVLIFLTPDGVAPTRGNESWRVVSYRNLIADIEQLYERQRREKGELSNDVDSLIVNYIKTIKRNVLMKIDPELKMTCRKFYIENKKVLDFIFEYGMRLKDDVEEVLLSLAAAGKKIAHDPEVDNATEFTVPALDEFFMGKDGISSLRAYKCFVLGADADSNHVCVAMAFYMTDDEVLNDRVRKFCKLFTGADWKITKTGKFRASMDLPWYGRKGKIGDKNWKDFSLDSGEETLSSAVAAAVSEFVDIGLHRILEVYKKLSNSNS